MNYPIPFPMMNNIPLKRFFVSVLGVGFWVLAACTLLAAETPVPAPSQFLVNDYAGMLQREQVVALGQKLSKYANETSTQIVVVTEETLDGNTDFDRALAIYDKWGIGSSEAKSNGVLIYVAKNERKIRIMTGQGSEGFLPDVIAKRIIDQAIGPYFKQGQFYVGLDKGTSAIMDFGKGEYTNDTQPANEEGFPFIILLFLLFFIFIIVLRIINRRNKGPYDKNNDDDGGYYRGGRYDYPQQRGGGWIIFPGGGGGWSNGGGGSNSSDGWGGFGGGGFGGFGGGFTGGGGAGGDW